MGPHALQLQQIAAGHHQSPCLAQCRLHSRRAAAPWHIDRWLAHLHHPKLSSEVCTSQCMCSWLHAVTHGFALLGCIDQRSQCTHTVSHHGRHWLHSTNAGVPRRHVITGGGIDTPLRLVPVAMAAAAAQPLGCRRRQPRRRAAGSRLAALPSRPCRTPSSRCLSFDTKLQHVWVAWTLASALCRSLCLPVRRFSRPRDSNCKSRPQQGCTWHALAAGSRTVPRGIVRGALQQRPKPWHLGLPAGEGGDARR